MSGSQIFFLVLLALVGAERIAELAVAKIHARLALERGGSYVEPAGAYAAMVVVHALFLPVAAAEAILLDRPFLPALAAVATLAVLAAEALRWWAVATLGRRWNTRPMVIPGAPVATGGPYRYVRHPNYVAVTIEMAALPLVHTAWITAIVWSARQRPAAGAPHPARGSRPRARRRLPRQDGEPQPLRPGKRPRSRGVTRDEILTGIAEVAREHLKLDPAKIRPDQRLVEDLELDSIRLLTLAAEVENRFRVALDPEDEAGIRTVGDLADVLERKLG